MNRRNVTAGVVLGLIGFAVNQLGLELFFNVTILLGPCFAVFALVRYGAAAGIIAGVIAASGTLLAFNHPWAIITLGGEAIFLACLFGRRSRNVILLDALYWATAGSVLVWLCYWKGLGAPPRSVLLVDLKQSLNGVLDSLLAAIAFLAMRIWQCDPEELPSLRQLVFVCLMSLALFPSSIFLAAELHEEMEKGDTALSERADYLADVTRKAIPPTLPATEQGGDPVADIDDILATIAGKEAAGITILDASGRVVASTRTDMKRMERFDRPAGVRERDFPNGVYHWIPAWKPGKGPMERWRRSFFVKEAPLGPGTPWTVVVEEPFAPVLSSLTDEAISDFLIITSLTAAALLLSHLLSSKLVEGLRRLQSVSRTIPQHFLSELLTQEWPKSKIREMNGLICNFKQMTYALYVYYAELKSINETLEQRVEERTAELARSEERYRLMADNASDLVFRYRLFPDHTYLYMSPSSKRLLGYAPEAFYADAELPFKLVHPDDRGVLEQARSGKDLPPGYQLRWTHRDGRTVWLDTRITVVSPPDGSYVEIVGISRDVTELKLHETLAAELEAEKIRVGIMEEEKRHLREKEMLVKDLHDGIGGIVTNIAMLGQYGLMRDEVNQCHETFARIVELASAGVTEIRSFMNSLESGESAWSDLLAEVKGYAERMFEPYNISLAVSARIAEGLPPIGLVRYANIVRICRETITNIIKHAGASAVTLTFSVTTERFELSIADNGVGYFPDTIKRRGLANMFSRAREVGADLTLGSSSDGSSVSIVLPLAGGDS